MGTISIAFIDDHPVLLEGLAHIFSEHPRFDVVALGKCASDLDRIAAAHPDLVLVDLNMPGDVFTAIQRCRESSPQTRIIVFTASTAIDHAVSALEGGTFGYVLKGSTQEELLQAIDMVLADETFITPSLASKVISSLRGASLRRDAEQAIKLSVREDQIVRLLLIGRTNKEIAAQLMISEKTVKYYMTLLMQKLHVRNRVEVVIAARELGAFAEALGGSARPKLMVN